jgi:hypothetical protein
MRIGARHDIHSKISATPQDVSKCVHIAKPLAAIVKGDLGGIEGNATARVKDGGIGFAAETAVVRGAEAAFAFGSPSRPTRQAAERLPACLRKSLLVLSIFSPWNSNA